MKLHGAVALATLLGATAFTPAALADDRAFSWTGFYVGASGTYSWDGNANYDYLKAGNFEPVGRVRPTDTEGFMGGLHTGYNHHFPGGLIVGAELGGSYGKLSGDLKENPPPAGNDYVTNSEVNWMASVTGKLGYAFDRLMVYAKGGYALTSVDFDASFHNKDGPGGTNGSVVKISNSFDMDGWVYGGGLEWAITDKLSFGLDYLRYDFGSASALNLTTTNSGIKFEDVRVNYDVDTVTARLNLKLN